MDDGNECGCAHTLTHCAAIKHHASLRRPFPPSVLPVVVTDCWLLVAGMITDVVSCQEFIDNLVGEAEEIITNQLQSFVVEKAEILSARL